MNPASSVLNLSWMMLSLWGNTERDTIFKIGKELFDRVECDYEEDFNSENHSENQYHYNIWIRSKKLYPKCESCDKTTPSKKYVNIGTFNEHYKLTKYKKKVYIMYCDDCLFDSFEDYTTESIKFPLTNERSIDEILNNLKLVL